MPLTSGPRVFIVGGHTYLGSRVAAVCQERDFDVMCLAHENQDTSALRAIGVEIIEGSTQDPNTFRPALKRCDWAINVHRHIDFAVNGPVKRPGSSPRERKAEATRKMMKAVNVDGAVNFLDVCIAMDVPKVLTLSSTLAIGDQGGQLADERSEHRRQFRSYYERTMYDALFQTRVRINEGAQIACVLPGPIIGPRAGGMFTQLIEDYVLGRLPWAIGGTSSVTLSYIDDVVRGIFQIMDRRSPVGLYIFANEPLRWEEFFQKVIAVSGVQPRRGWVKESALERAARGSFFGGKAPAVPREMLPYLVDAQYRFSCEKARTQVGWDFTTMETWLAEMVAEIREAGEGPQTQAAIETFTRSSLPAGY